MKTKLTTLAIMGISLVSGFSQSFEGSIFDLDSGRLQAINGTFTVPKQDFSHERRMANMRADYERIKADTDRIWAEIAATRAQAQLEEQTRLLRKITEQQ